MPKNEVKKVVLAYSGGLDTSVILKWLQDEYAAEVVTFTADLGQGEELEPARQKALACGIKDIYIDDLREEFVADYVYPMFRANAVYEGVYLLGTAIARPLIAKRQIEIARATGADAVSHGATGKGNDQVRFELGYYALNPDIKVIAPWREWGLTSREKLIEYAETHGIAVDKDKRGEAPFSVDANLLHTSSEGKLLENPATEAPEYVYCRTVSPEAAPDTPTYVEIEFEKGDAVGINGVRLSPAEVLTKLFTEDVPYGAEVNVDFGDAATGWNAPPLAAWLETTLDEASKTYYGKPCLHMGEGGSIPFMAMLNDKFPDAQFVVTGVLGPNSNAHGPNEFLHVPYAKKLTACIAHVLEAHGKR